MVETNAMDGSSIRGTAEEHEEVVIDSDSKFNQKHTEVTLSKAPQNVEVVEQDHTRIRVLDFLVLNIEAACNIIKNNTVKTLELAQIYGSFLKNHSNAEKILAQSVELIKQLQDFDIH